MKLSVTYTINYVHIFTILESKKCSILLKIHTYTISNHKFDMLIIIAQNYHFKPELGNP